MLAAEEVGELLIAISVESRSGIGAVARAHEQAIGWCSVILPGIISYLVGFLAAKRIYVERRGIARRRLKWLAIAVLLAMGSMGNALRLCLVSLK